MNTDEQEDLQKRLRKAVRNYDKAHADLMVLRDKIYPPGTQVILMGVQRTVTTGSLYADQVYLDRRMHAGFTHITKVEDSH